MNAEAIQPRNDYVLIRRIDKERHGSIIIPEVVQERGIAGIVEAVGPGKLIEGINGGYVRKPVAVKPGDMVLFNSKWNELGLDGSHESNSYKWGHDLHLVQEADIFVILDA